MHATGVDRRHTPGHSPLWIALPLVVFALVALTVGVAAKNSDGVVDPTDYLRLFFSDPIHLKAWFATAAMTLACFQVLTAAAIYGRLAFLPQNAAVAAVHRWSGRLAILITLPVAYHCIFQLGYGDYSTRVTVHSLLGSAIYGAVVAKVLIVRSGNRIPGWELPIAGGILFSILLGLWLTSSVWFFDQAGIGV
ncbi:MAG: hypothetical protein QOF68_3079 [Gaiellales bacterium]|nr:hypothetical protein [Gaiellales bacterium]